MLRRNRIVPLLALLCALLGVVWAQQQPQTPPPPAQQPQAQQPAQQPVDTVPPGEEGPPTPPPNQPGDTVQVPAGGGKAPETDSNGGYTFIANVDEVVLHATVVDDHQHLVTTLDRNAFSVFEDGAPQKITSFRREDVPVAVGIVIDNSGSMRDKRAAVNQAAINFVRASNKDDQVFIVNFNDDAYLDQDFTASIPLLKEGLEHIDSRGGTALYDAVMAAADHLAKSANRDKKVLLVVTDGEDNASRASLEQAVRQLQAENGPTVYTIGILGEDHPRRAKRALDRLAVETGGVAFFPKDVAEVDSITQAVARDIRNQYIIIYKPSVPKSQGGGFRNVKVEAKAKGYNHLQVRTRTGYYAGQQRAAR